MRHRLTLRTASLAFLGVVFAAILATAAPVPKSPPAEQVTVKKSDGTSISGELLVADHVALTVRPPKGDALLIPWKQVASVSNGLNRQLAILRWKTAHKDQLCGQCIGDRTVKHDACNGTGIDPEGKKECATCKGTGTGGKCTNAKCVNGKVDCPGPCLKLSVGTWKDKDGHKWREFPTRNGSHKISDNHLGQVWGLTADRSAMEQKGPCPVCAGAATYDCPTCDGKGHLPCKACDGAGVTGTLCKGCNHGRAICDSCKGKGLS
jgi:hypothetical protein